jgi:glyoxylase-like metal-dependent hydrolase (beta-lactamase superfamily II)
VSSGISRRDDVGDHAKWAKHFNVPRILHKDEVVSDTAAVEIKLEGEGPWQLPDSSSDIDLIFTPGHTSAHVCLYHKPTKTLFSGDHLSQDYADLEALMIFHDFNWYSVPLQVQSVQKLLQYDFLHVLPGHGRQIHLKDAAHRLKAVGDLVMKYGDPAVLAGSSPMRGRE